MHKTVLQQHNTPLSSHHNNKCNSDLLSNKHKNNHIPLQHLNTNNTNHSPLLPQHPNNNTNNTPLKNSNNQNSINFTPKTTNAFVNKMPLRLPTKENLYTTPNNRHKTPNNHHKTPNNHHKMPNKHPYNPFEEGRQDHLKFHVCSPNVFRPFTPDKVGLGGKWLISLEVVI